MAAQWVRDAIWWQVHPLGFVGAEREATPTVTHRLGHLTAWLEHAQSLGANGLALGPVFAAETHGYDTVDHLRIDPRLGDLADFDTLVAAAHAQGFRVLLDGVFHHVGRSHPAFRAVLEQGRDAPTAGWFRLDWPADGGEPVAAVFEGHQHLVALDHTEPAVVRHVVEVMTHWLDRGVDGWRLDAAYAVPPAFWAQVLPRVRERHPDAYVVGEVIHGDYAAVVTESTMDSVTQYELWQGLWHGIAERNLFETAHALARHSGFLDTFVPWTFVGNHDVTRVRDQVGDPRHAAHALVVWATVGGTPAIWSGDELGWHGVKEHREGGDDAVRPTFPATPAEAAGDPAVLALHQELVGLRRRHRWLHTARTTQRHLSGTALVYETAADGESLLVALNLDDAPVTVPATGAVLAGAAHVEHGRATLPAHGWAVLDPAA